MESEEVTNVGNNSQADKIDIIDLTKESPVPNRQSRYTEPCLHTDRVTRSNSRPTRALSPMSLENVSPLSSTILDFLHTYTDIVYDPDFRRNRDREHTRHRLRRRELTQARRNAQQLEETIELDDSSSGEESNNFTVESDTGESISLTCPICLESLSSRRKPVVTKCGHIFCYTCLQRSLRELKKCPNCKSPVNFKSCVRIYI